MGEGEAKAHGEQCDISAHWPKQDPRLSWIVELHVAKGPLKVEHLESTWNIIYFSDFSEVTFPNPNTLKLESKVNNPCLIQ